MFEDAVALAAAAHRNQVDKQGQPYLLHVMRVVLGCSDDLTRTVAALHDVLEDTTVWPDWSQFGGEEGEIATAVKLLTRSQESEPYGEYIVRVARNRAARMVKVSDLRDNLSRIGGLDLADQDRLGSRYRAALAALDWGR